MRELFEVIFKVIGYTIAFVVSSVWKKNKK